MPNVHAVMTMRRGHSRTARLERALTADKNTSKVIVTLVYRIKLHHFTVVMHIQTQIVWKMWHIVILKNHRVYFCIVYKCSERLYVVIERQFSAASQVMCARRCRMFDETLDKLVFLQSRLRLSEFDEYNDWDWHVAMFDIVCNTWSCRVGKKVIKKLQKV